MKQGAASASHLCNCWLERAGPGGEISVVWLGGEHDIATRDVLADTLAEAIALDEPSLLIDLGAVNFISATTIGLIVDAKDRLAQRGRSLVLRAPPPSVRRVFDVCGLSDLLPDDAKTEGAEGEDRPGAALRSWAKVPTTARDSSVHGGAKVRKQVTAHTERPLFVRIP